MTWLANDCLYKLNLKHVNTQSHERRILVYHGVTANAKTDINARFISTHTFEQHLRFFKKHFHVVSLEEYVQGAKHPEKLTLAITFDDGYLNNLTEALPLLEKYELHASFYITTIRKAGMEYLWADLIDLYRYTGPNYFEFMGIRFKKGKHEYVSSKGTLKSILKNSEWNTKKEVCQQILAQNNFMADDSFAPYFALMNEAEIKQLSNSKYASIGSHGLYHNCLTKVTTETAMFELETSKAYLENIIQHEVTDLAYPDGDYNAKLIDLAEELGYKNQLLVDYLDKKEQSDTRTVQRFGINPYISFENQMQCIVNGYY